VAVRVRLGGVPGPRRRSCGLLAASGQVRRRGGLLAIQCSRIEKFGIAAAHWTLAAKCTAKRMLTCGDAWTTNASASAAMRIVSVMSPGPTDIGLAHDSASGPQELQRLADNAPGHRTAYAGSSISAPPAVGTTGVTGPKRAAGTDVMSASTRGCGHPAIGTTASSGPLNNGVGERSASDSRGSTTGPSGAGDGPPTTSRNEASRSD
jgi:hypothetical protein